MEYTVGRPFTHHEDREDPHVISRILAVAMAVGIMGCGSAKADIETREITYSADGVEMTGFLAWDGAVEGKRP
ncbi:MAG: hypothetical protein GWN87_08825, partial [Desulfuromonadales bacterium]|nr:hypothetical protein [Desulfuromonadales bacterium]